jgi:type VI secretion system protein ImpH
MPAYGWGGDIGLEQWLFDEPHAFDFFQAVHLLELWSQREAGPRSETAAEPVRFRASFGLSFPPSAISQLKAASAGAPHEMTVAFSSLGGIDGPLPTSFTEEILRRLSQHDGAAAAFLDIFHHRLISLLYRIRRLRAPALAATAPEHTPTARYLFSLMGIGLESVAAQVTQPAALLRYAGLLATRPRSASGLAVLLSDYFDVPVRVEQFVGQWIQLQPDQVTNIGQRGRNNALGRTTTLGTRVWIQDAGVRLQIGPLDADAFAAFLPDGASHQRLAELVRVYSGTDLTVDITLILRPETVRPSYLGASRVGWTSWLLTAPATTPDDQVRLRLQLSGLTPRGTAGGGS